MEVWNNVFTQFEGDGKGGYTELAQKNIDTGMGLERLAVVMQDVDSVFDIDTMKAIRDKVCEMSGKKYQVDALDDVSIRLITDHIRSATFMISDGIMPSNEGRGYVLRRIIRRAARHGRMLGIDGIFMAKLAATVINESKDGYPELEEKKDFIFKVLSQEEEKFGKTIDQGLSILSDMEKQMEADGVKVLSGENAFKLYDTYGFPMDLTQEILEEKGFSVDEEGFKKAMEVQRTTARKARKVTNYMGADETVYESVDPSVTTEFVGYDSLNCKSKITVLTTETEIVEALSDGEVGTVIVEQTPFYATMGGQQGDKGIIRTAAGEFQVEDTIKLLGGKVGHVGKMISGMMKTGDEADLSVDAALRAKICKNHSATHLLQKALREVLGTHVEQAGSYQDAEITHFDFTHFSAVTPEELVRVQKIVNDKIFESMNVTVKEMPIEEAKKLGAMALFGEKYGKVVRVVDIEGWSTEFCGGTHVKNTAQIGGFKIVSESSVAAGIRRIEAVTGRNLLIRANMQEAMLHTVANTLKANNVAALPVRAEAVMAENKAMSKELEDIKAKVAASKVTSLFDNAETVGDVKIASAYFTGTSGDTLRGMCDTIRDNAKAAAVAVLVGKSDDKITMAVTVTKDAQAKGLKAGNLVKEISAIAGGKGGGKPDFAMAGLKDETKIDEALAAVKSIVEKQLG